jgi:hypothetical protein
MTDQKNPSLGAGLVQKIRSEAANAKITVQPLSGTSAF